MTIYNVLEEYLSLTEKFLTEKQEVLQKRRTEFLLKRGFSLEDIERQSPDVIFALLVLDDDEDDADVVFEAYSGYPYNITYEFPNLFRKSLFVTIYSIFESKLHNRCKFIEENYKLKLSVSDLTGKGIIRSKNYLEKVAGLELSSSNDWPEILSYNKLRNCLVHNNSILDGFQDEKFLRNYIAKHTFLDLDHGEILLQEGFCEECIEKFKNFEDYITESFHMWLKNKHS